MTEYFAGRMLKLAIDAAKYGVRDLRNPDLAPFYSGPSIPAVEVAEARTAVQELHVEVGISPISDDAFASQAGVPSQQFFLDFLNAAGIETVATTDITVVDAEDLIPELGFRTSFIREQSRDRTLTIPEIRSALRSRSTMARSDVQHLTQLDPLVVADSDPYVVPKLRGMRQYIARYLTPS